MVRADIYLTNLTDKKIAVGMTAIEPGKTEKILQKDFERKASYIDRMVKEKRLSLGGSPVNVEAPSDSEPSKEGVITPPPTEEQNTAPEKEEMTNNEDASEETSGDSGDDKSTETEEETSTEDGASEEASENEDKVEEPKAETEEEAVVTEEPKVEVEEVPAPKTRRSRKK